MMQNEKPGFQFKASFCILNAKPWTCWAFQLFPALKIHIFTHDAYAWLLL